MLEGWSLDIDDKFNISLTKDNNNITFDRKVVTGLEVVLGIKVKRRTPLDMATLVTGKRQDVYLSHGALGHPLEQRVRAMAA